MPQRLYSQDYQPALQDLENLCSQQLTSQHLPLAKSIKSNIPIYNLPRQLPPSSDLNTLQDEWNQILLSGPGVFVVKNLYSDYALIDRVNKIYDSIIAQEKEASSGTAGDHFASSGLNSRIWNSFSKHCLLDASSFAQYYSNPWLAAICESWLGPMYRITAQVNIVHPGGKAQIAHRDYHLGFQSKEMVSRFPKAMHTASQFLTLQGAVAHTDMPVESGPTRLLPFSQQFEGGYLAFRTKEFNNYFLENYVSLPLEKGDGLFFNPALFHAAGENKTKEFSRSANLLQISCAFGKPMESIDTLPLVEMCWDDLVKMYEGDGLSAKVRALIAAVAEGYSFPTNLDRRQPAPEGMCPASEQDVLVRMVEERATKEMALKAIREIREDGRA